MPCADSPPLVAEFTDPPYDPGTLAPGTTYENATPAENKTWGAIKALYR